MSKVRKLSEEALKSTQKINNLVEICKEINSKAHGFIAIKNFAKVFEHYVKTYKLLDNEADAKTSQDKVALWLYEQYQEFVDAVKLHFARSDDEEAVLGKFMEVVKLVGDILFVKRDGEITDQEMKVVVDAAIGYESLLENYLKHPDFMYSLFSALQSKMSDKTIPQMFDLLKFIAERMPKEESDEYFLTGDFDGNEVAQKRHAKKMKLSSLRKKFGQTWLEFLRLKLPGSIVKRVLMMLDSHIIPNFNQARLLADFLIKCYDRGGGLAVLSLQGLFQLLQFHNLELDDFYTRLYKMLEPRIFEARYQQRFFVYLNRYLGEHAHVGANVHASFCKKLARLALVAPPIGARICIELCLNLVRRHTQLWTLVDDKTSHMCESDPFDEYETDPGKTGAERSSLWELKSLEDHYLPEISTKMATFRSLRKYESSIEELCDEDDEEIFLKYADVNNDEDDADDDSDSDDDEYPINDVRPTSFVGGFEDVTSELWAL